MTQFSGARARRCATEGARADASDRAVEPAAPGGMIAHRGRVDLPVADGLPEDPDRRLFLIVRWAVKQTPEDGDGRGRRDRAAAAAAPPAPPAPRGRRPPRRGPHGEPAPALAPARARRDRDAPRGPAFEPAPPAARHGLPGARPACPIIGCRASTRGQERPMSTETQAGSSDAQTDGGARAATMLTVTDNRTGKTYELPIEDGTVRATDLRQIKVDPDEFGLMSYDPAFMNTASCRSSITYIDGDAGILQHRGYSIEQLCEHSTYLEVAYLLINGRLPDESRAARTGSTRSRSTPSCTRTSRTSCRASATTPTRWGCWSPRSARSRPSTPTPTRSTTSAIRGDPDHPPARQDADAGGLRLPPQHGPALRLSRQRPRTTPATSFR